MLPEQIIYITIPVSILGYVLYFRSVFYGTTRPNLVSWFLWMLGPFIGVFFQLKAGAGLSVLPVFFAGFGPLVVIIISLLRRNVIWKIGKLDIFCGVLSLAALVMYVLTHNLGVSILFAILADGLAAVPTIVKAWNFPETEFAAGYLPGIVDNMIGLLIIKNWIFTIYSFSIYFILVNSILIFAIYRKKIFGPSSVSFTS
jgi:hypothetical protein